jgi:hypothetical protein
MNKTSTNETTNIYLFRFERYIIIWLGAIIGTIFSCLALIRYFRFKSQRTQLTYVYHFSLGFCLILSLISTPLHTLTDYFSSNNSDLSRRLLCNFDLVTFFIASSGIGYSIAYASLERTFFIFYSQNIRLTWIRQFTPFLIIFSLCSLAITLLVLLFSCSLDIYPCLLCYFSSFKFQFIWFLLQFIIPFLLMLIAVLFLIYRIEIHTKRIRTSINRRYSRQKFQRILIHLNIYNIYYLLSICPISFYLFIRNHINIEQSIIGIILINYIFLSLQSYSILIYLLTNVKQQQHRIVYHQEQKQSPYIIITRPSVQFDEYERTRL